MIRFTGTIQIDKERCIQCGKCAQVCPSDIMIQDQHTREINVQHMEHCIDCGHCVDVCPVDAVIHSDFPPEVVHTIDYTQMPTPEQVMLLLKSRRSNRTITSRPIPHEWLKLIVEAACCAPTASNSRQIDFTLITDPEKLRQIGEYTVEVFDGLRMVFDNRVAKALCKSWLPFLYRYIPTFRRLRQAQSAGKDPILRGATALLVIHTPKSNRFGCEDANLAYQNASLMAQSLGVSQIYMGFIISAIKHDWKGRFGQLLGVDGKPQAIMALGIPAFRYPKYVDRCRNSAL